MGIKKIINRFYQNAIQANIQKNARKVVFPLYNAIKSATVLCSEMDYTKITSLVKLVAPQAEVVVISFIQGKREANLSENEIYSSDVNWYGIVRQQWMKSFRNEETDILINLTDGSNRAIEYICAVSRAKFKIAKQPNGAIYDLVVQTATSKNEIFVEEIVKILKQLKSRN